MSPLSGDAIPRPKSAQLTRGHRRYRRKVASPRAWAAIRDEKMGPCRVCEANGDYSIPLTRELHHLVSRGSFGDDVADNLVPLCRLHHALVTARDCRTCETMLGSLTDAEYAYMIDRGGENYAERAYGLRYSR